MVIYFFKQWFFFLARNYFLLTIHEFVNVVKTISNTNKLFS